MKSFMMIMIGVALAISGTAQSPQDTGPFEWLQGTWERISVKQGQTAYEVWNVDTEGNMSGLGCTLRGADTVFTEHLKIVKHEGEYYYSADVSHNAAPVLFKITEIGQTSFVSENPQHDFPKRITYNFDGTLLTAVISAGTKEIPFRFRRKA